MKKTRKDAGRKTSRGGEGSKRRRTRKNQKRSGRRTRRQPRKEKKSHGASSPQLLGLAPPRIANGCGEESPVRPHPGATGQGIFPDP